MEMTNETRLKCASHRYSQDNESTASGSQLNLLAAKMNSGGAPTAAKRSVVSNGNNGGVEQEVHDGHYFIKVCCTFVLLGLSLD